jgi:hypothetical protein
MVSISLDAAGKSRLKMESKRVSSIRQNRKRRNSKNSYKNKRQMSKIRIKSD